jgi:hypothetical protein
VADPVVLRLLRANLMAEYRAAVAAGTVAELARELMAEHIDRPIACLLCDAEIPVGELPRLEVVDPGYDRRVLIGAALCASCVTGTPHLLRVARCLRMLRKMGIRR